MIEIGATLDGKYRLERELGRGGMGAVFEAVHGGLDSSVAIKTLLPQAAAYPQMVKRFLAEARAAARLDHPHTIRVLDVNTHDGVPYQVLELLHGETLQSRLERGAMSWHECWTIMRPILSALQHAHDAGVIHRDIKPDNIFLANFEGKLVPKLVDFGIAKLIGGGEGLTQTGMVMGTPLYLSPEQARSTKDVGPESDIWSIGVMMYEALAGQYPFDFDLDGGLPGIVQQICEDEAIPLNVVGVADEVGDAIMGCLRKSPKERIPSARELSAQLAEAGTRADFDLAPSVTAVPYGVSPQMALQTEPDGRLSVPPGMPTVLTRTPAPKPRSRVLTAVGAVAALAVTGAIAFALGRPAEPATPPVIEPPATETVATETVEVTTEPASMQTTEPNMEPRMVELVTMDPVVETPESDNEPETTPAETSEPVRMRVRMRRTPMSMEQMRTGRSMAFIGADDY